MNMHILDSVVMILAQKAQGYLAILEYASMTNV